MRTCRLILLLLAALWGLSPGSVGRAYLYRYVDAEGRHHYSDTELHSGYQRIRRHSATIAELIDHYAGLNGLSPQLVRAVVKAESNFVSTAVSHKGAQGLMQLLPETARDMGIDNPFDPAQNIAAGTRYLRQLVNRFDGNLDLALAAYNAGPTTVSKYGGVPPFEETRTYLARVKRFYANYSRQDGPLP